MGGQVWRWAFAGTAAALVATAGCAPDASHAGADADGSAVAPATASTWLTAPAVSVEGLAYELTLDAQPRPSQRPADDGFARFAMEPAGLTVRNLSPSRGSSALVVDVFLFHDCSILSTAPSVSAPTGVTVISRQTWTAGDDRFIASDGDHCVQRLAPATFDDLLGLEATAHAVVGLDDVGFVSPNDEAGRITTMLGTPRIVQFGVTPVEDGVRGDVFYSPRISVGSGVTAVAPASDDVSGERSTADTIPAAPTDAVPTTPPAAQPAPCPDASSAATRRRDFDAAPPPCLDAAATYQAIVTTSVGELTVELDAVAAPATVNNFVYLTRYGYYDDTTCHRAIKGFVVQCGDPTGTGFGGPGYTLPDELPTGDYQIGDVAMANSGPDTNGSQFFIVGGVDGTNLPPNYTRFGRVVRGLDDTLVWLDALGAGEGSQSPTHEIRIESIRIVAA